MATEETRLLFTGTIVQFSTRSNTNPTFPLLCSAAHMTAEFTANVNEKLSEGDFDTADPAVLGELLRVSFLSLDQKMKQLEDVVSGVDQSGCTAIGGLITDAHCIVANTGDSRGIFASNKTVIPMSFDHKPTDVRMCVHWYNLNRMLADDDSPFTGSGDHTYRECRWLRFHEAC